MILPLTIGQTPAAVAEPNAPDFKVQQWHTGVWLSWDRSNAPKSLYITVAPEDAITSQAVRFTTADFAYIPLTREGPRVNRTFLISIIDMDFILDGVTQPPDCRGFTALPAYKAALPPGGTVISPAACLTETIYSVRIDINNPSSKPVQLPGVFFAQRARNMLVGPNCRTNCWLGDPRTGGSAPGDIRAWRESAKGPIVFVDALFFGLPKYTDVYLENQAKNGKWYRTIGQELSTSYSYFTAESTPILPQHSTKYRFRAYAKTLRKYVLTTKAFDIRGAFTSSTQASAAPELPPVSSGALIHSLPTTAP